MYVLFNGGIIRIAQIAIKESISAFLETYLTKYYEDLYLFISLVFVYFLFLF